MLCYLLYLWQCSENWPEYLPTNPTLYTVLSKLIFKYPLQRHFLVSTTSLQLPSQLHNIWHDSCILPLEAQLLKLKDGSFFASCDFTTDSKFFKSAKKIISVFMLAVANHNVVLVLNWYFCVVMNLVNVNYPHRDVASSLDEDALLIFGYSKYVV